MGCDIHAFIEYQDYRFKDREWVSFSRDQICISRDYHLFGLLAGVRSRYNPIIKPRGIPNNLGSAARDSYCFYVIEEETDYEGQVDKKTADSWVAQGLSNWWDDKHITRPDWHTPSYLYAHECETVLMEYKVTLLPKGQEPDIIFKIVVNILNEFVKQGYESRLVFWFDN